METVISLTEPGYDRCMGCKHAYVQTKSQIMFSTDFYLDDESTQRLRREAKR